MLRMSRVPSVFGVRGNTRLFNGMVNEKATAKPKANVETGGRAVSHCPVATSSHDIVDHDGEVRTFCGSENSDIECPDTTEPDSERAGNERMKQEKINPKEISGIRRVHRDVRSLLPSARNTHPSVLPTLFLLLSERWQTAERARARSFKM